MTKFIDVSNNDIKEVKKETVFTHCLSGDTGWIKTDTNLEAFESIKYLGNCGADGDMFACLHLGTICIYKGTKGDEFNQ